MKMHRKVSLDNNLANLIDDDDDDTILSSKTPFYADKDEDGFGADDDILMACNLPDGYLEDFLDCNDNNVDVNPNADELCGTEEDDNCDGDKNENTAIDVTLYYQNLDDDGYGVGLISTPSCSKLDLCRKTR